MVDIASDRPDGSAHFNSTEVDRLEGMFTAMLQQFPKDHIELEERYKIVQHNLNAIKTVFNKAVQRNQRNERVYYDRFDRTFE